MTELMGTLPTESLDKGVPPLGKIANWTLHTHSVEGTIFMLLECPPGVYGEKNDTK